MDRREFLQALAAAGAAGLPLGSRSALAADGDAFYEVPRFGNVSLLHMTDCHAQLLPVFFREPSANLGIGAAAGKPPHLVGEQLLRYYGMARGSRDAYAFTHLDFPRLARTYGRMGGFAHLATLVKRLKASRPGALLLDGGDTWQGSATALWTRGQDMIDAQKLLGVDLMTGHWEFTYGQDRVKQVIEDDFKGRIEFIAQNVATADFGDPVFKPYVIREINGARVAIIGQAFPYTPIANPRYFVPDWTFGIKESELQKQVDEVRAKGAHAVVLLSHNGMDVDLKLATRVTGIDAILGGHTHDGVPRPVAVKNAAGATLVTNAGSNGKFLGVLDMDVRGGRLREMKYRLLPVFSNLLPADREMAAHIATARAPHEAKLAQPIATTEALLYRRGNFNGTLDITYPMTTLNDLSGETIKAILEDVCDNLFNPDPYYQQGGDMVRVGGLTYTCTPGETIGKRIGDMRLDGRPIEAGKLYKVAGWAPVAEGVTGEPIWDVIVKYLRDKKTISQPKLNLPKLIGVDGNPGIE